MELNLSMLLEVFLKRLWVIILAFVIAAGCAFGYCEYLVTPQYSATASILVTNGAITNESKTDIINSISATDITASLSLVDTITDILKTSEAYRETAKASGGKYKFEQINNTASIARKSETTLFINISFTKQDRREAVELANLFAETSCKYITKVIPYSNAVVVSKSTGASLVYPRTFTTCAVAGLAAALVVYVIFFLVENNNRIIRNEDDFAKHFNIPVIGAVPDFENSDTSAYTIYKKGK